MPKPTSSRLAIIAGHGQLPQRLAAANPEALFITFDGEEVTIPEGQPHLHASFEKMGALFKAMRAHGVEQVVFAGAVARPALNPLRFDLTTARLAPRALAAMGRGDDALLRMVIEAFEGAGFAVLGAAQLLPELCLTTQARIGRAPTKQEQADATRAEDILRALSPQDVGQSCAVAAGQCLGIETVQGTDALLRYVATTPAHLKRGEKGVLVKLAKQGQDLRIDMPTIGPDTIEAVASAGLAGLFISAGSVIVLEQEEVRQRLLNHDLFLVAR